MTPLRRIVLILICIMSCTALRAQWERIGPGGGYLMISAQQRNYIYGADGTWGHHRSSDYGKTWSLLKKGMDENYFSSYGGTYINYHNEEFVSFVSNANKNSPANYKQGIYMLRHGDTAWRFYRDTALYNKYPLRQFISYDSIFAVRVDTPSHSIRTFLSTDAGKVWTEYAPLSFGNNYYFYKLIKFKNTFCVMLYTIRDNFLYLRHYLTKDIGKSWTLSDTGATDSLSFESVANNEWQPRSNGDSAIFIGHATEGVSISTTTDGGVSWRRNIFTPEDHPVYFITQASVVEDEVFFSTESYTNHRYYNATYRSRDWGSSWEKLPFKDSSRSPYIIAKTYNGYVLGPTYFIDTFFIDSLPAQIPDIPSGNVKLVYAHDKNVFAVKDLYYDTDVAASFLYSKDEGSTWKTIQVDSGAKIGNYEWFYAGKQLYTTGLTDSLRRCVLVSDDDGFHWRVLAVFANYDALNIIHVEQNFIFAASNYYSKVLAMYLSTDQGGKWKGGGFHPESDLYSLPVYHDGKLYAGVGLEFEDYSYSSDLGESWESHFSRVPIKK